MVALLTMTAAVAQNNDNGNNGQRREFRRQTPEEMTNRLSEQLKLTEDQKTKVLALNKEWVVAWVPAWVVATDRAVASDRDSSRASVLRCPS